MKAIVFDFDGTLTHKTKNIWYSIWNELGYPTDKESYYYELYQSFMNNKITHKEWCDYTCDAFKQRCLSKNNLDKLASKIELIGNIEETLQTLKNTGYKLYILSGNISYILVKSLGTNASYFESINGNQLLFDNNGIITEIEGTEYDFEGKAKFINDLCDRNGMNARKDVVFVGNGENDEWAYTTGCKTICINPDKTDPYNHQIWTHNVGVTNDLSKILQYINVSEKVY